MRQLGKWVAGAGMLALVACAAGPQIRVAPNAPDKVETGAIAQGQGVQLRVDANEWNGFPQDLRSVVPLRVTIFNESEVPVRVQYQDFKLVPANGGPALAALPPLRLSGRGLARGTTGGPGWGGSGFAPIAPKYDWYAFYLAPGYVPFYSDLGVWEGPWAFDPAFYETYSSHWPVNLPTGDMINRALPEGVVQPGGQVSGFVYFQGLPRGTHDMSFQAILVDAKTQKPFGRLEIPFIAKR